MADVVIVFPPAASPMHPPQSLAALAGGLRQAGRSVATMDLNAQGWRWLYDDEDGALGVLFARRDRLLAQGPSGKGPGEEVRYNVLSASTEMSVADIGASADLMRRPEAFSDAAHYQWARNTLEMTNRLISAVLAPLTLSFHRFDCGMDLLLPARLNPFAPLWGRAVERLVAPRPRLIGVSIVYKGQLVAGLALCELLRNGGFDGRLVLGGAALGRGYALLGDSFRRRATELTDALVFGEGESALCHLAGTERQPGRRAPSSIPAAGSGGSSLQSGAWRCVESMAELPCPSYDDTRWEDYMSPLPVIYYDGARGCYWGRCAFCSYGLATDQEATAPYRDRGANRIADHLVQLADRYHCRHFVLADDCMRPKTLLGVAAALNGRGLRLAAEARAERFFCNSDNLGVLYSGGLRQLYFGIEAASQRTLDLMRKGTSARSFPRLYEACWRQGLAVGIQTFLGFPGERYEDMVATLKHLEDESQHLSLSANWDYCLLVGSEVWRRPDAYGVRLGVPGDDLVTFDELRFDGGLDLLDAPQREHLHRLRSSVNLGDKDPWAGSAMSAHTTLCLDLEGREALRRWKERGCHDRDQRFRGRLGRTTDLHDEAFFERFPCHW